MSIDGWPGQLEAARSLREGRFTRVRVLAETASTQDAARRLGCGPGEIVVAGRQTAGRGRLGRRWADTADAGAAGSFVLDAQPPERLAIRCAVATAQAIEAHLDRRAHIKWPNDIVIDRCKLAGILIEQANDVMIVGVGINVLQTSWPDDLAATATSLALLGSSARRIDVIESLIDALGDALEFDDDRLVEEFAARDVLCGAVGAFRCDNRVIAGRVRRIDPLEGLEIETDSGPVRLPAATTSVESWEPAVKEPEAGPDSSDIL